GVKIKEYSIDATTNARCLITAAQECGYDGVHPGVDVTIEGEAVGSKVEYPEDNIPFVIEYFLQKPDINKLSMPNPDRDGRMPMIIESTRRCAAEVGEELYICSVIMGPMNCASQIRGVENLMFDFMDRPDFVKELLGFCTEIEIRFGQALIDAGAHSLIIGEALCSPVFVSPKLYHDFIVPYQNKLITALFDHGVESTFLHTCADISRIAEDYCVHSGTNAVDIDWQVDMKWLLNLPNLKKAGTTTRGNLDPAGALLSGTPEEVIKEAKGLLESVKDTKKFILGSGCDMNPKSLPDNARAMVEASKRYGVYEN
ncbi:MAG: uroporphyrinogen decarboxylase family protein, partial [Deltaproteobacteria bacterium]|nr:uroporphyrinogen decarboxylase family protein [Deltaproteobacteria bacterium]